MEDNRKRLIYTQTQYIIAIIWYRIIREATLLTFYPPPPPPSPARIGFPDPGYDWFKFLYCILERPVISLNSVVKIDIHKEIHKKDELIYVW